MKMNTFKLSPFLRRCAGAGALLVFVGSAWSCALYRNDRCYVSDAEYGIAYDLFLDTGSLDLVERQLTDADWRRCKVNEVVYRLKKQFEIIDP
jgi:hypothetical protein